MTDDDLKQIDGNKDLLIFTAELLNLDAWEYYRKEEVPTLIVEAVRQGRTALARELTQAPG